MYTHTRWSIYPFDRDDVRINNGMLKCTMTCGAQRHGYRNVISVVVDEE